MHYTYEIAKAENGFSVKVTNEINGMDRLHVFATHAELMTFMAEEISNFKREF